MRTTLKTSSRLRPPTGFRLTHNRVATATGLVEKIRKYQKTYSGVDMDDFASNTFKSGRELCTLTLALGSMRLILTFIYISLSGNFYPGSGTGY